MAIEIDKYWASTEETLNQHMLNLAVTMKHGYQPGSQAQQEDKSRLLDVQGSVGVISIRGALTNRDAGYGSYETTYPEIRQALIQAAADPAVKAVVMDISSGGGSVAGVSDTGKLIRTVDGIKPVYAFSDSMMASAAYWLGSSARKVYASEMAEVGSIGVITTHMSMHRLYTEMGIDPTVIRAGEYKALGHPMEPLSDKAKATIQGQLDQMYGMFAGYVAERRGMNIDTFNKTAGEGRVFIGAKGVEAGLLDGVTSFDKLISRVESDIQPEPRNAFTRMSAPQNAVAQASAEIFAAGGIAFSQNPLQSGSNVIQGTTMKKALTEQQLAALAEGAGAAVEASIEQPEQAAAPAAEASQAEPEAAQAPEAAAAAPETSIVQVLQAQLQASQDKVIELSVEMKSMKAELEGAKNANAGLRSIAQASIDRMKVALGMPGGVAAANDEALLAEHGTLRSTFEAKFKSGGVAAVSAAAPQEGAVSQPDPARQARIQATRLK